MTNVNDFIINSDFETLSNDDDDILVVTVPAGSTMAAGAQRVFSEDIDLGSPESMLNIKVSNSFSGPTGPEGLANLAGANKAYLLGPYLNYARSVTITGTPVAYNAFILCSHVGGDTIRCSVVVTNPTNLNGFPTMPQDDVFTFHLRTYKPPVF